MIRRDFLKQSILGGLAAISPSLGLTQSLPNYERKRFYRIAHITDIHMFPLIGAAKGLEKCLHHIQNLSNTVDIILNTGDSIMEAHKNSSERSNMQWKLFHKVLKQENSLPIYNIIGNHDICCEGSNNFTFDYGKKWAMDELLIPKPFYSIDTPFWKIILLDSVQPLKDGSWYTAYLDDEQLDWLEKELESTTKSILISSHIPILSACVFFDGDNNQNESWKIPSKWMHADSKRLSQLFHKHKNVKLAVSGHIHLQDRVEYNGVTYCCNGAVAGDWWKGDYQHTAPGYAIIDLFDDGSFENKYVSY